MASRNDIWTVKAALDWTTRYLDDKGDETPRLSAQWLIAEACGMSRIQLYTNLEQPLSNDERALLRDYVRRRSLGEPLQYIVGEVGFRFLTLEVAYGVLIPRPETEVLVSEFFRLLPQPEEGHMLTVADVGCGSGCIACSLATERPDVFVYALDIAPATLDLASKNAGKCGADQRIEVRESDMLTALLESHASKLDAIISNPPYIPTGVLQTISREVTDYEPMLALDGGADGLDTFRVLLEQAQTVLALGGVFAVELHETCLDAAATMAREAGFADVFIHEDLSGKPRILTARWV